MQQKLEDVTSEFKNFLTNQGKNTLENKLHNILQKQHIKYIDFLIGYFRITGFNKIVNCLDGIKEARILVGINIDRTTFDANSKAKNIDILANEQSKVFNDETSEEKYSSVELLVSLLAQKDKLKIRVAPNNDIHAKLYILRDTKEPYEDSVGSVIIGSSNLTYNGLKGNFELNTQLNHSTQIDEATKIFNVLWEYSEELTLKDVEDKIIPKLKNYPQKKSDKLTPYQLYIKLLIEHFGKRIDFMDDSNIYVPKEYKKLSYQVEAVNYGIAKLTEHSGFFLSDVVGLGKTVVIAMLIKKLEDTFTKRVLVVIPPAVRTQWEDTLKEFEITFCKVVSLGSLAKVNASKYELVIVDESHKFKNAESKRYKQLYEICIDKKVILLSATPQNNTPNDLYNQIALFQNVKNSTLPNCQNLQSFFTNKELDYKKLINSEDGIDEVALKLLSEEIRDKVLRTVMIRRTRYDIQHHDMYKVDIIEQGLSIPGVNKPKEHEYKLEGKLGTVFDDTAIKITQKLNYSRFNLLAYLTDKAKATYYPKESDNIFKKNPLAGLMKTLLIKRFESSFSAFKISIGRHAKRYETFIKNYENDIVYLGEKATDILDYDEENEVDYEEFIQKLINARKVKQLTRADFKKGFEADLKSDYEIFKKLVATWKTIDEDPKVDTFKKILAEDKDKKIVIFTESIDTLNYLKSKLLDIEKILFITSKNREEKKQVIKENFDANYEKQKSDYNIIITTDTLAEGINLHRSSIIYNYDIPWNATKLIQRIGSVNRIGTRSKFIDIHNFKPASHIDELLALSQKAFVKLQSSHTMMGEDNQIYTKEESVGTVNLFDEYKKEANEKDDELEYLVELRLFRDENEKEFSRLSELKEKLTLTRKGSKEGAYVVLDVNGHKHYVYVGTDSTKSIGFIEAAKVFRADANEIAIKSIEDQNEKVLSLAIAYFEDEFKRKKQDKAGDGVLDDKSQKAEKYLKEWLKDKLLTRELFKEYREAIRNGTLGIVAIDEINQLHKLEKDKIEEQLVKMITKKQNKQKQLFDETLTISPVLSEI